MREKGRFSILRGAAWGLLCAAVAMMADRAPADQDDLKPVLPNVTNMRSVSTVPPNGDLNPYGVAFVPPGFAAGGPLSVGDVLVSNFNNSNNLQGTGTTIVRITPAGQTSVFFQGNPGLGLTTALGILHRGFVLVGNVPTEDGTFATIKPGSLLVLSRNGGRIATISDPELLDGPWDLAISDRQTEAKVFVSNVLSGTVTRLDLLIVEGAVYVLTKTQIASGYGHRSDPAALVVGPTGLAYDPVKDLLYVASTDDNAIFAIAGAADRFLDAGKGELVYQDNAHLHGPLALTLAPNGHLITSNGDAVNPDPNQPSELVEFTPSGKFVAELSVDPAPGGAFGLALAQAPGDALRLAAVDDNLNALDLWTVAF